MPHPKTTFKRELRKITMTIAVSSNKMNLEGLDKIISDTWNKILNESKLVEAINSNSFDKYLYAIYMVETYHYTSHNARNQALVGTTFPENPVYAKYCFHHASEEVGHEKMAYHDLISIGINESAFTIPAPLPETEILISYLYWISSNGNPIRRLGYSYWAESCYQYINPLIYKIKTVLQLKSHQLTFFIAHSEIDEKHANEVTDIIQKVVKDEEDINEIITVAKYTLNLTGYMLDAVYKEYVDFLNGDSKRYNFLRDCLI
jgi:hypothetical protein